MSMASGEPLDLQRDRRWPPPPTVAPEAGKPSAPGPKDGKGVQVKREPWELDEEYEDMEGIFGSVM